MTISTSLWIGQASLSSRVGRLSGGGRVMGIVVSEDTVSKRGLTLLLRNVSEKCRERWLERSKQKNMLFREEEYNIVG